MAMGIPVVATNVGGIPEIIDDGVNGFLVEPKDSKELAGKITTLLGADKS
jgi:glycosyltransferase involved in cell wall biosynthesis